MVYTIIKMCFLLPFLFVMNCYTVTEYQYLIKQKKVEKKCVRIEIQPELNYDGENEVYGKPYKLFVRLLSNGNELPDQIDSLFLINTKNDSVLYKFISPVPGYTKKEKNELKISFSFPYLLLPDNDIVIALYYKMCIKSNCIQKNIVRKAFFKKIKYRTSTLFEAIMGI